MEEKYEVIRDKTAEECQLRKRRAKKQLISRKTYLTKHVLSYRISNMWDVLADKGYQVIETTIGAIMGIKIKANCIRLERENRSFKTDVRADRVREPFLAECNLYGIFLSIVVDGVRLITECI